MKRAILRALCPAFALGLFLFADTGAQAELVTYVTTGTFASSGTGTFNKDNVSIVYNSGSNTVNLTAANPSSLVTFGQFNSSATSSTVTSPVTLTDTFTLQIFQTAPSGQALTYAGSLTGTLEYNSSGGYILFNSPLSQSTTDVPAIFYNIVSQDSGTPGRVNISAPTTANGVSSIAGQVVSAVPEPSSMAMLALGASASLLIGLRSRRRMLQTVA